MSWDENKRSHGETGIRDSRMEHQIAMSLKAMDISATPENLEIVHRAIAGRKLSNKEIDDLVKTTFSGQPQAERNSDG